MLFRSPLSHQRQAGESPVGRIGAAPRIPQEELAALTSLVQYGPFEAIGKAWTRSWETAGFTLRMIGRMVIGEVSLKNVSGPITIAEYAGQSAQLGMAPYLSFLALISISLFVLNLLPVPVLDGGHLLYYTIEFLKGSPLSERTMEFGQHVGIALIMVLMAFALFNDVTRVLS